MAPPDKTNYGSCLYHDVSWTKQNKLFIHVHQVFMKHTCDVTFSLMKMTLFSNVFVFAFKGCLYIINLCWQQLDADLWDKHLKQSSSAKIAIKENFLYESNLKKTNNC